MGRLIVCSNRVTDPSKSSQSGGLAVAIGDALRESGGLWFGWDGTISDMTGASRLTIDDSGPYATATVPLTDDEHRSYYTGMSNNVLWPVLHYRLDLARLDATFVHRYRQVNSRFADLVNGLVRPSDLIWVHDYHLIPLGAELRARGCGNAMGFFLHIPFPPPDVLVALPSNEWFMRSIFSYDVVGFQTQSDLTNFQRCVEEIADGEILEDGRVAAFGRTILAKAFPISIDVEAFRAMAETPESALIIERLQRRSIDTKNIIGVDRLDYTKGLPERFRAFERLLEDYPDNRKQITLMQIAPPTREDVDAYSDIREELERLSGAINGRFADFDWTPIRYIHRSVPRAKLAALFRGSRLGLVTPLRDGMNLVAKEYIAAQDPNDPGVLVLSKFAGAAEEMTEALIVNPYDASEVSQALQLAITMSLEERQARYEALYARIKTNDIVSWRHAFVGELQAAADRYAA